MAIDTAFKRRSAAASRRMPWMRRFGIAPTGTISQAQRQQGAWVYGGILAGAAVALKTGPVRITAIGTYQPGPRAAGSYQFGPKSLTGTSE